MSVTFSEKAWMKWRNKLVSWGKRESKFHMEGAMSTTFLRWEHLTQPFRALRTNETICVRSAFPPPTGGSIRVGTITDFSFSKFSHRHAWCLHFPSMYHIPLGLFWAILSVPGIYALVRQFHTGLNPGTVVFVLTCGRTVAGGRIQAAGYAPEIQLYVKIDRGCPCSHECQILGGSWRKRE